MNFMSPEEYDALAAEVRSFDKRAHALDYKVTSIVQQAELRARVEWIRTHGEAVMSGAIAEAARAEVEHFRKKLAEAEETVRELEKETP